MTVALRRVWAKDLDAATLYELLKLRVEVVVEQACPYPELDGGDLLAQTWHFWLEKPGRGGTPACGSVICTLRLMEEHAGFVRDADDFFDNGVPHVPMLRPKRPPPAQAATRTASSASGPGSGVEAQL